MASGKAMANPARSRGATQAEVEAKLRDLNAKMAAFNRQIEKDLASPQWYPYAAGAGLAAGMFGLGAVFSAFLF